MILVDPHAISSDKSVMSAGIQDCCGCETPQIFNTPGTAGAAGPSGSNGTNGVSSYTVTTIAIDVPGAAGPVVSPAVVTFASTAWMSVGQVIFISDGVDWGHFRVLTLPSATSATLTWLDYQDDAAAGSNIATAATVSASGAQPPLAAALPTALTDNSTGTASSTIAAGVGVATLAFPINLVALTAAAADLMTNYVPGYAFKILAVDFVVTTLGTGAGATMSLNLEIGATNITGGVVNPTLANTATLGTLVTGTAVTAANIGTVASTLSIEVAVGGTIFTAGQGVLLVKIQNLNSANAFASLAANSNALIVALT